MQKHIKYHNSNYKSKINNTKTLKFRNQNKFQKPKDKKIIQK